MPDRHTSTDPPEDVCFFYVPTLLHLCGARREGVDALPTYTHAGGGVVDPAMITAIGGVLVALLGAIGALLLQLRSKVAEVHEQTNSRMTRIEEELRGTRSALEQSQKAARVAESARQALAAEAATMLREQPLPPLEGNR